MTAVMALTDERRSLSAAVARPFIRSAPAVVDGEPSSDAIAGNSFSGYAAVYNTRTAIGNPLTFGFYEQVAPSAFSKTLQEGDARFLIDHNPMYVVSRASAGTLNLASDSVGLAVNSALDPSLSYVNDLVANVRNKNITGMSFGFQVVLDQWTTESTGTADGQSIDVEIRTLQEVRLIEVSAVTFPQYTQTQAEINSVAAALTRRGSAEAIEKRAYYVPALRELCGSTARSQKRYIDLAVRGAIPAHSTSTTTAPWDGPGNIKNIPSDATAAELKSAFAWVNPDGNPTAKASYKFPHHIVSSAGDVGDANTVACSATIASLNGGRTTPDIPDADRQGVWNHVAQHLKDAKLPAPPLKSKDSQNKKSLDDGEPAETTHDDSDVEVHETHSENADDGTDNESGETPVVIEPVVIRAPKISDRMRALAARYRLPI